MNHLLANPKGAASGAPVGAAVGANPIGAAIGTHIGAAFGANHIGAAIGTPIGAAGCEPHRCCHCTRV